jgi:hypothetical protein
MARSEKNSCRNIHYDGYYYQESEDPIQTFKQEHHGGLDEKSL